MKSKPMTHTEAWAVVTAFGFVPPGTWGKPMDGLAIYRSKKCAQEQARASAHTEYPERVVRVEIRAARPAPSRRARGKGRKP